MPLLSDKAKTHQDPSLTPVVLAPDESRGARKTSFDVADFPVPHGREEDWRFTPVDRLTGLMADEPTAEGAVTVSVSDQSVVAPPLGPDEGPRGTALLPGDRAAVLAHARSPKALHLKLADNTDYPEPVRVDVRGAAGKRSNGHVVIEAGVNSSGLVIMEHTGSGEHTANVEIIVGDGAHLTVVSVQQWDDDALHLAQHEALVGRDATYRHIAVTLGGRVVRINSNVRYDGPGGDATLFGVYFADAGQHLEHRTFIDHNAPHTKSLVTYKGALQGDSAHTVWVGDVLIRAEAEGIETYELNRNLVLTDGARADSVPNLEIETGEIEGAGHASSTGRFDDEQLFYLQARGIPEDEARRLVVRGFFADLISKIGVPSVVEPLMEAIDTELAAGGK